MEEGRLHELISRYLSGETSPTEEQDLFAWTKRNKENQEAFEEYQELWQMTESPELPFQPDPDHAWNKIRPKLKNDPQDGATDSIIRRLPLWSKAAAIALFLSLAYFLTQRWSPASDAQWVVHATTDEQLELVLPDETSVTLNANSHLRYKKDFSKRQIQFEGEAYFDVARDEHRPFTILSGETEATVLGTAFNLRAYPKEQTVELTMQRGKVAFGWKDKPEEIIILTAEESGIFFKSQKEIRKAEKQDENALSWKKQALYFNDDSLSEIVEDLERYFHVDIELANPKLGNCQFKSDFDQPDLDQIITVLKIALNLKVQRQGDKIVFAGKGCE